jgi:hypothetical protein
LNLRKQGSDTNDISRTIILGESGGGGWAKGTGEKVGMSGKRGRPDEDDGGVIAKLRGLKGDGELTGDAKGDAKGDANALP